MVDQTPPLLTIAHLSDTHFGGRSSAAGRTHRILDYLATMDPPVDVVLVTGDIADHGLVEEYAEAKAVLESWAGPAPMLMLPGNHDVRSAYAEWRDLHAEDDRPLHAVHVVAGSAFVLLDSMVPAPPGERIDHGELDAGSLQWLDQTLRALPPDQPVYVCLHHPPVRIHQARMDNIRLRADDAAALEGVLRRHRQVRALLCGHAHTACATTFAGIPVLIGGGAASTVTLEAEELPFITGVLPPSFALHLVDQTGHLVTHWRTV
jgi:3',5'-cyclic-AMP phosphodiesterase